MAIIIFNPNKREVDGEIKKIIDSYVDKLDNLVICIGGDGSILGAEREYPGIPKLAIKASNVCHKCIVDDDLEKILAGIETGAVEPKSFSKLEITIKAKKLLALNEFSLKSQNPREAIRFKYNISNYQSQEIIADGMVVATVFGATGYFKSITKTVFNLGIGIGINNPTNPLINQVISEEEEIKIEITRGIGIGLVDNNPEMLEIAAGDKILVVKSPEKAFIY